MLIKLPNRRWIEIRYKYWTGNKLYFSKLLDGFIFSFLRITVIAKLRDV